MLFESRLMRTYSGVHRILFGVEHYERYDTLEQPVIKFGISLPAVNNSSRHEVIVAFYLLLSTTSTSIPAFKLRSDS